MTNELSRKYRPIRIITLLFLAVILSTLIFLFRLVSASNNDIRFWHVLMFLVSCTGCFILAVLVYYVKGQRERTSRLSEEKYRSIIAVSGMGAWEFHADTGFLWCSAEYFQMLGYSEQDFLQHHKMTIDDVWINMLHPDDRQAAVEKFTTFFSEQNVEMYESTFRLKHNSGNWIWVMSRCKALRRPDGAVSKVMIGTHVDITERISIQLELHRRNQKLMNFAFSIAHHVRGPVARMLGLVELVKLDKEKDHRWYVETITNQVKDLDEIIKSIAHELDDIDDLIQRPAKP